MKRIGVVSVNFEVIDIIDTIAGIVNYRDNRILEIVVRRLDGFSGYINAGCLLEAKIEIRAFQEEINSLNLNKSAEMNVMRIFNRAVGIIRIAFNPLL